MTIVTISTYYPLFDDNRYDIYVLYSVWWQSLPYLRNIFCLMTIVTISTYYPLFDDNHYRIYVLSSVWWQTLPYLRTIFCLTTVVTISTYYTVFDDNRYHVYAFIHSFIHSFIADIYIAPLQVGLLRSTPNPSAVNNAVLSCWRNFWEIRDPRKYRMYTDSIE